jgi:hypothetical protein
MKMKSRTRKQAAERQAEQKHSRTTGNLRQVKSKQRQQAECSLHSRNRITGTQASQKFQPRCRNDAGKCTPSRMHRTEVLQVQVQQVE